MKTNLTFRALANPRRRQILGWLKAPKRHFPPQVAGDLAKDGVCGLLIARKLRISQPTLSEHMKVLCQSGLVDSKRIRQWIFYRRSKAGIRQLRRLISAEL
jgi:ArsR family transcriptional regulator